MKKLLLVLLLGIAFWFVKDDVKSGISIEEIAEGKFDNAGTLSGFLNCYMPVIGYVESHYVETKYLSDPSYDTSEIIIPEVEEIEEIEELEIINEELPVQEENEIKTFYSREELSDLSILLEKYYTVTTITELKEEKFDVNKALDTDFTIQQDSSAPQILVMHTHSQEDFVDSVPGDSSTTIVGVGTRLCEILSSEYGYNVIHDTTVYDYVDGVLDRSKAYTYAEKGMEQILKQYPTIEVILDIHRDGVAESVHLVSDINGKPTAQIMFFNGISYTKINGDIEYLPNPYIQDNLAMSLQMRLLGDSMYPGLLRKNYINGYRYTLHYRPKSMLIEVGAQNNTLQEELNAMEPLADMLNRLLSGEKAYE